MTPMFAIRISYDQGFIEMLPQVRRLAWASVIRDAHAITRLPDLVGGRAPYNAIYRVLGNDQVSRTYLVEEH